MATRRKPPKAKKAGTSKAEAQRKKALFVEAMIQNGGNQTQAAVFAGYKAGRSAEQAGMTLSKDQWVIEELARRRKEVLAQVQLKTEDVVAETVRMAFSDIRKLFDETGALKNPSEWPDDIAQAVAAVEVVEMAGGMKIDLSEDSDAPVKHVPMYTKKIKLWDKNSALEKLFKHLGLYEKDNNQKGDRLLELLQAIDGKTRSI